MSTILIVIVNYRTPQLVVDCLHSLASEVCARPEIQVVVMDNDSGDHSSDVICEALGQNDWPWVRFEQLSENGGFAAGNNAALRGLARDQMLPDYVLLLNPDTYIREEAVNALCRFMDMHPEVGIAGSRLEDPDGTPQRSAFRYHSLASEWLSSCRLGLFMKLLPGAQIAPPVSDTACETGWVAGASMIIRREVIEQIGLLDEQYFMYYEEVDFCLRAKRAGWSCWYVPESRVVHLVGQASGVTTQNVPAKRRPAYWFESRRHYFRKNYGRIYLLAADLLWLIGFGSWRLRRAIQGKPDNDPPYMLWDFFRYSFLRKFQR